jgi:hypothetical protein
MNDQRSLTDQMRDLIPVAIDMGMYDAADFIERKFPREPRSTIFERPPMESPPKLRHLRVVKNDEA